jgi:hypothetical protein
MQYFSQTPLAHSPWYFPVVGAHWVSSLPVHLAPIAVASPVTAEQAPPAQMLQYRPVPQVKVPK